MFRRVGPRLVPVLALALTLGAVALASPAHAAVYCNPRGTSISGGGVLAGNDCLRNGIYNLVMQGDGNLVLYKSGTACWASSWEENGRHRAGDKAFVYVSNLADEVRELSHTRCPRCQTVLIERADYVTQRVALGPGATCASCGERIPGVWSSPS